MPRAAALVLGGGLALGAYHLGAVERILREGAVAVEAVAGSSIGAFTAAILAGNRREARLERLRAFWERMTIDPVPAPVAAWLSQDASGIARHAQNWLAIAAARLGGVPGLSHPAIAGSAVRRDGPGLYAVDRAAETLAGLIDVDRLNGGEWRVAIATTDIETGEAVVFDTAAGDRITLEHILASGSLLPAFAPIRIDGRLLGDGGLAINLPLEPFLASDRAHPAPSLVIASDLFASDGGAPRSLATAAERSIDLSFANQSRMRIDGLVREWALLARLPDARGADLVQISYRPPAAESGPDKTFDFSRASLLQRAQAGRDDADAALRVIAALPPAAAPGLHVHRIRRD